MNRADRKEYTKAYYEAHRDEILAKRKAHYEAHREERKAYKRVHREEIKSWYQAHKEDRKAYSRDYYQAHKEDHNAYKKSDTNSEGITKNCIRSKSNYYLFKVLNHTKVEGYEIHHCFGYDDYRHFIYIPKALHLQIHQYLRDNNVDADSNHYAQIEHIIINYYKHNDKHFLVL